jgi:hypothetical protein
MQVLSKMECVSSAEQVLDCLTTFNRDAEHHLQDVRRILGAPKAVYWVYHPQSGLFGPNKFCGFVGMTFSQDRAFKKGRKQSGGRTKERHRGVTGGAAKDAIEAALQKQYGENSALHNPLRDWALRILGDDPFKKDRAQKWKFITLDQPVQPNRGDPTHRLRSEEGEQPYPATAGGYTPIEGDYRHRVERQICERRGQQAFRDALRERYGDRCLLTGCEVLAVLEAAHINPYRGSMDHHPENGLLLRSDIHTLFDLDLLGIKPDSMQVELHPSVMAEYGALTGRALGCSTDNRPSRAALEQRYEQFVQRLLQPV